MIHYRILLAAFVLTNQQWGFAAPTGNTTSIATGSSAVSSPSASAVPPAQSSTDTATSSAADATFSAGYASDDPNYSLYDEFQNEVPEAIRGTLGATVIGPQNIPLDRFVFLTLYF